MQNFLKKYPISPYLISFFFIWHGFVENYYFIPVKEAGLLVLKYIIFSLTSVLLFWLLYKNLIKASLLVSLILSFNFLFGNIYDFIKNISANTIFVRYSFILPFTIIFFTFTIVYLKKTKNQFTVSNQYLNWLFSLLILIDTGNLILKSSKIDKTKTDQKLMGFVDCKSCPKPDIYLIIADEYAGQKELIDIFNFDNNDFLNELKKRKYHVLANSFGNYNFTHYAMASTLNMNYLSGISGDHSSSKDISLSFKTLKENKSLLFLLSQGYSFYNYSIFNFNKQSSPTVPTFIPSQTTPLNSQTFLYRIRKDLGYHLMTTLKLKSVVSNFYYNDLYNNEKVYELTKSIATTRTINPKFVYTHLVMPHYRYYFDSKGQPTSFEKVIDDNYCADKKAYLEYLKYSNGKLLTLIDHIKSASKNPPIIILMSDHGYHQFLNEDDIKSVDKKYYFMTLNAVYFPDQNYSQYYDSLSNVNQFRIIFNSQFGQALPLLKDSTIFLAQ